MSNILKDRLRSSLCGIAACSVLAVSVLAVPLATVKAVSAEQEAYWCEEDYNADGNICASSANFEYDYNDYENYGVNEEQPYQAEVKHSTVATSFDLTEFVSSYNAVAEDDSKLNASEVEYSATVNLLGYNVGSDSKDYASYFDFDGDNGYIVINSDNEVLDLKTSGDCDYLREEEELYFSMSDGFVRVDDNGMYRVFTEKCPLDEFDAPTATNGSNTGKTKYPGQEAPGDGKIDPTLLNDYVNARYPGYSRTNRVMVSGYNQYSRQMYTSYYVRKYSGVNYTYSGTASEGNCSLNAMYNVMSSWNSRNWIHLAMGDVDLTSYIKNDLLYDRYVNSTHPNSVIYVEAYDDNVILSNQWVVNNGYISHMPLLYHQLRNRAVYSYGYDPIKAYEVDYYQGTMEYVANTLNENKLSVGRTNSQTDAQIYVSVNKAVLMVVYNSSTYNTHVVALHGYYEYTKSTELSSNYKIIDKKYFYRVADGHNDDAKVFDPNTDSNATMLFFVLARC